jgi:hypothetical protein
MKPKKEAVLTQPLKGSKEEIEIEQNVSLFEEARPSHSNIGTAHFNEGPRPVRDVASGENKLKNDTSTDEANLGWEEYLAKQQYKFKKLYGKKLIVEDDYSKPS